MNIVDVLIILLFITALLRGIELGLVRQLSSTAGLVAGVFLGAFVQGKLINSVATPASKAMLSLLIIIMAVIILSSIGEYIGVLLKSHIQRTRLKAIDTTDRAVGSAVAGATLLLVVWLGASIFNSAPFPAVQKQIKGSVIVAQLNKSLPPAPDVITRLGHLINPNSFPDVFTGLEPRINTDTPLPSIGELDPAVQATRASIVKIQGAGCGGVSNGSGFVADDGLVVTNAHVIAGVKNPTVVDGNGKHNAQVIWFDPDLDMAVLRTTGLAGQPLALADNVVSNGTQGAVLGFPGGGDFAAGPATVLDSFQAVGRNIYNQGETEREVYSIKGAVEPGNSGGPLINKDGTVIGLIFAESTSYDDVGYALTMNKVIEGLDLARDRMQQASTGSCTH